MRRATPLALLPLVLLVAPAGATACRLVADPAGDTGTGGVGFPAEAYDILSADVASDATTITAEIRVADVTPTSPVVQPANYELLAYNGAAVLRFWASNTVNGQVFRVVGSKALGSAEGSFSVEVTGSIDVATDTIRVSAPIALLPSYAAPVPGTVLGPFEATVWTLHGSVTLPQEPRVLTMSGVHLDFADTTAEYVAGDPACIAP